MSEIAIDMSIEAMTPPALSDAYRARPPADQWLARRTHAFGGSEVAPLLFAYGLAPLTSTLPGWVIDQGEVYQRLGVPKILAWKSNLRAEPAGDEATKKQGNDRERELLGRFKRGIAKHRVRPESIRHADSVPREWFPLVDRHCVRVAVTPDAWARWLSGPLCTIQIKCTFKPFTGISWHHYVQTQTEIATMEATGGILLVGERWVKRTDRNGNIIPEPDGPVRAFTIAPDPDTVRLVRTVATEAWSVVEQLRALALEVDALGDAQTAAARRTRKAAAQRCAEVWSESRARMQAFADPTRAHIEDALSEIEGIDEILLRRFA